ncbi:MAG TPA: substrate-binding domain-containing protein [Burkholderiales bacterium]
MVRILSAGAAQAVVQKIAATFTNETGNEVKAEFSAVGEMKARVLKGEPVDVIVLTGALIDELIASGHIAPGSRRDLGAVATGVAVRAGTPLPDVSQTRALRESLLAAAKVVCPDPATATAGKAVMQLLDRLGIDAQVRPRMQYFPNGYAAMRWLAESRGTREMGITQATEILANPGVTYVGPLPGDLGLRTVYAAGLAARAQNPGGASEFITRLTAPSARAILAQAGYEFEE